VDSCKKEYGEKFSRDQRPFYGTLVQKLQKERRYKYLIMIMKNLYKRDTVNESMKKRIQIFYSACKNLYKKHD